MKRETIKIAKIVNGGYGCARLASGQVTLVRHVLPKETVMITIAEAKKNHLFGELAQIVEPHPARIVPPCKYYGQCGGCDLQHCDYSTQLTIKRGIVEDLLSRQGAQAVRRCTGLLADPIPSPADFGYRQRIRLQVGQRGVIGFHRFHAHDLIAIDSCLLAGEAINSGLAALRSHEAGRALCELSTEVELQLNPLTGKIVGIFHWSRKVRPADVALAKSFCREMGEVDRIFFTGVDFAIIGPFGADEPGGQKAMDNTCTVRYPALAGSNSPLELSWEAGGFCQVNLEQNSNLIETVVTFCRVKKSETVLDLYCGMGNFAIPLAMGAKEVVGIEGQGSAIRSAGANAARAGLGNTCFRKSPIHPACLELADQGRKFDCVVIDPPRLGIPDLAAPLAAITGQRLVYISCDPATLCRDLAALVDNGFKVKRIQPLDMFPQTHHIETVVLLEK